MIITQTPFRMSFFGGGTDMESFFRKNGGAVLSTTFDKYCHVSLENIFLAFIRSQARTKWGGFCKIFCVRNRKNCTVLV